MVRTRSTIDGRRGKVVPKSVIEIPSRGRDRARDRGISHACGVAQVSGRGIGVSPEPEIIVRKD